LTRLVNRAEEGRQTHELAEVLEIMDEKDTLKKWAGGCRLPLEEWAWLNRHGIFEEPRLREYAAPFPPKPLISNVSGLTNEQDFAQHGVDIYAALTAASPRPLTEYENILDFGCGCGRLARMFKGHPHRITGCDVDPRHVSWIGENLDYMRAVRTAVHPPLPFERDEFDLVIGISVFTHMNELSQDGFLDELHRITAPGGRLLLTVHGSTALKRAKEEKGIYDMLSVDGDRFAEACDRFRENRHAFILQHGHLTQLPPGNAKGPEAGKQTLLTRGWHFLRRRLRVSQTPQEGAYEYGITFIPEAYITERWTRWFRVEEIRKGAIHNFQDIVVLRPEKGSSR